MGNRAVPAVVAAAAALAAAAVVLATRHIALHLRHYSRPQFQLHIVRILAMVPLYSLTSVAALVMANETHALVLELVRDSYEAYVIYNFVVLLIKYGGGHLPLCRYLEDQPRLPHAWPLSLWLPPLRLGPAFLNAVRAAVLQFVFVKPAGAALKLYAITHAARPARAPTLAAVALVNNLSISVALYGLVLFYHAAHHVLRPFRPFQKFLSVKAVVFFSFWQGVALSAAVRLRLLHDVAGYSAREQATGLQDLLICLEMAVAAVAHYHVFSYSEYSPPPAAAADAAAAAAAAAAASAANPASTSTTASTSSASTPSAAAAAAAQSARVRGKAALWHVVDFRDVLSDARERISGGVGFEAELREQPVMQTPPPPPRDYGAASLSADLAAPPWRLAAPPPSAPPPRRP